MRVVDTPLPGLKVLEIERIEDSRGFFARTFCTEEARSTGLEVAVAQCSISFNLSANTLRGMHWQAPPHGEDKFIRCTRGAIFDVAIDIRKNSPTFGQWFSIKLSADNRKSLYVPAGFAHGFLTCEPNTEVYYQISKPFAPNFGRGLLWNDVGVGVEWPSAPSVISDKDSILPTLEMIPEQDLFTF
jgi:dTDP-4-dehydrorhamnose 3,5-epimerase